MCIRYLGVSNAAGEFNLPCNLLAYSGPRVVQLRGAHFVSSGVHQQYSQRMEPPGVNRDDGERTTAYYRGYKYTRAWTSRRKVVYRCSRYRSTGCKGLLHFTIATMGYSAVRVHTCRGEEVVTPVVNVLAPMTAMLDGMALSDLALPASDIWEAVRSRFYPEDGEGVVQGLNQQQVINRVYRIRRRSYGGDVHGMIELPPLSLVRDSNLPFFQFHSITPNEDTTPDYGTNR